MDYVKPLDVVKNMVAVGDLKAGLTARDLVIRGFLSGALLGFATSLALSATLQTNTPLVGALVFPVGFVMIVLLGLELVTGSFALVPLAAFDGRRSWSTVVANLGWVFLGNLIGSVVYGALLYVALTNMGLAEPSGIATRIIAAAEAKTNAYAALGEAGMVTVFVKAVLCNWMVCLGVVMAMTSQSTVGKIAAMWLPILTFFAQGFEHSVVNMFLIPTGMLLGAKVTVADWWLWNQIPVTLGNLVGGLLFTGLFLYWTYSPVKKAVAVAAPEPIAAATTTEPARA
ncbi:formate/nitrite transporter family protein [Opitutus terrae]|uniref:Formate/nitrite transporter n=1 Tax=Opitutus terrae (strain DSM 11246 / JCM 15787 / PB90-1) TaxID=452637 RepID=B1ZVT4_OPITP|nr:formate/nitrite transporter family protein [Opitutus terrae]ACB75020.1 formate/nitrite transporter [Opitutus terrae PB90-1]